MTASAFQFEIQKFIGGFKSIHMANAHLTTKFNIDVTIDHVKLEGGSVMEPVWIYNYDMIKTKGDKTIENEARGLILNAKAEIVSMSFPRFFNAHERHAAKIDWTTASADAKADGTLVVIYEYKNSFHIQTRRSAEASVAISTDPTRTYSEAVLQVLKEKFDDPYSPFKESIKDCNGYTWAFEYVSPKNRIVTDYAKDDLFLLGMFNKNYVRELSPDYVSGFARHFKFERPHNIKVDSLDMVLEALEKVNTLDEGYVIRDRHLNRIKVKNPGYLAVSRAVNAGSQLSPKHFAKIVLNGDTDEIVSYYDEFGDMLILMRSVLEDMFGEVEDMWDKNKDSESRKELALAIKDHSLCSLIFMRVDGKIENLNTDALPYIKSECLVNETKMRHETTFNAIWDKILVGRGQNKEEEIKDAETSKHKMV